jgi:hypothetical protein
MTHKVIAPVIWTLGGASALILLALIALMIDWSKSGARTAKDDVIREKTSPDGKLVAEMHELTTAMHGGPDSVSVTIRQTGYPYENETIYSRVYECDDFSGFDLQWKQSNELTISYGNCNSGRWHTSDENRVLQTKSAWHDVKIDYRDSGHLAIN